MTSIKDWDFFPQNRIAVSLLVGALVMGACILSIGTRLLFDLASFWPTNALLLALLALRSDTNRPLTWIVAFAAYMAADLLSGCDPVRALWLNSANLAGVATGLIALRLAPHNFLRLAHPRDSIFVAVAMAAASAGTALVGMQAGRILFGMSLPEAFAFWFATEYVNYAILLPVAISFANSDSNGFRLFSRNPVVAGRQLAAVGTLFASVALVAVLGGPGATAFVLPALIWCAIRLRPLPASILTFATCLWMLVAGQAGLIPLYFDLDVPREVASFRLSIGMVALAAFAVAAVNAAWRLTHADLAHSAAFDTLTAVRNRGSFMSCAGAALRDKRPLAPLCLLMIDLDHFKTINDTYGHAAGDAALQQTAALLKKNLRNSDLVGRLGGEEFAILLPETSASAGHAVAENIRHQIANMVVTVGDDTLFRITTSIGMAEFLGGSTLSELISASDSALYAAKHGGRNRVVCVSEGVQPEVQTVPPLRRKRAWGR